MERDERDDSRSSEAEPSWAARARSWLAPPLDADLRERFESEIADRNRSWLLGVAPIVGIGHAIHIVIFHTPADARAALAPEIVRWREAVTAVHAVTLAVMVVLALAALRWGKARVGRHFGPAVVLTYLVHGAVTAGVDQLASSVNGVGPFTGYCLFFSVFVTLAPRVSLVLYATGAITFVLSLYIAQPSPSERLALLPNGVSIAVVSMLLSWILYATRRRDFAQRTTILAQRAELSTMNAQLERRVSDQVSEIVMRAAEVDQLNAQLRAQVRARSTELSFALAKVAQHRETDGTLRAGVVLAERFEIADLLGEGGMGVVYSAVDRTTGARVAIKVIQASSTRQLDALHRFIREAKTGATVAHPAIVRALHVDVSDDGMLFQVQELVEGVTLQRCSGGGRAWEARDAARVASVLFGALAAAHAQGIVHRDVKPANIMLTATPPGLKLLDFGIAKLYENALESESGGSTRTGAILGTPAFMAPEQIEGMREATAAADVYAAGLVLFVLLSGRHPFDEETLHGIVYNHLCVPAPDVRTFATNTPLVITDFVTRCLAKDPTERPTAAEIAQALDAFANAEGAPVAEVIARAASASCA